MLTLPLRRQSNIYPYKCRTIARSKTEGPMQPTYRTCSVYSENDLRAVWTPGAPVNQQVRLRLLTVLLSADCIMIIKQQASHISSLLLGANFVVQQKYKQEFLETLLSFSSCKEIDIWRSDAVKLRSLYRLCYRSPLSKSLVSMQLGYFYLDCLAVCRLTKSLEQGTVLKEFGLSGYSNMKTSLSPMFLMESQLHTALLGCYRMSIEEMFCLYHASRVKKKNWCKFEVCARHKLKGVVFNGLKLSLYAAESLNLALSFRWPSGEKLVSDEALAFFKATISEKLRIKSQ